jgi:hypothetical protein
MRVIFKLTNNNILTLEGATASPSSSEASSGLRAALTQAGGLRLARALVLLETVLEGTVRVLNYTAL